jgi:hypothetical protein
MKMLATNESNNNMVVYKDNNLHKDNNLPTSDKSITYNVVATVQNNDLSDLEIPLRHINQDNTYNTDLKTEIQNVKFSSDIATALNQTALNANIPKKTLLRKIEKYEINPKDYY